MDTLSEGGVEGATAGGASDTGVEGATARGASDTMGSSVGKDRAGGDDDAVGSGVTDVGGLSGVSILGEVSEMFLNEFWL